MIYAVELEGVKRTRYVNADTPEDAAKIAAGVKAQRAEFWKSYGVFHTYRITMFNGIHKYASVYRDVNKEQAMRKKKGESEIHLDPERDRRVLLEAMKRIAKMNKDGEIIDGKRFDLSNDDAVDSLHNCINLARATVAMVEGAK